MLCVIRNADGSTEGADPRKLSTEALNEEGHSKVPLLKAIRAKCLDCSAGNEAEVRKCVAVSCALWPYRMGKNPFARAPGRGAHLRRNAAQEAA
jgi:hypothetical protein